MKIAGVFDYHGEAKNYYTDDFTSFYNKNRVKLSDDTLNEWAICLNSPWSQTEMEYKTELNCESAYTKMKETEPKWRTIYTVRSYDFFISEIYGYGDTPQESLENCISNFTHFQEKYNPENKYF